MWENLQVTPSIALHGVATGLAEYRSTWSTFPTCSNSPGKEHDKIVLHVFVNRVPMPARRAGATDASGFVILPDGKDVFSYAGKVPCPMPRAMP